MDGGYHTNVHDYYLKHGFGGRVGFGQRPALVVIDLARSWLDDRSQQGSSALEPVLRHVVRVLSRARAAEIPIFFTTMQAQAVDLAAPIARKLPHMGATPAGEQAEAMAELDPRLERRETEELLIKPRASAFWGTPFEAYLTAHSIDTLLITGCSTSGCVRSTAESAHNRNLHTVVIREAVGDRSPIAHEANLTDIDLRYADVVGVETALSYLEAVR